jgi:hypothetical protein
MELQNKEETQWLLESNNKGSWQRIIIKVVVNGIVDKMEEATSSI